MRTPTPIRVYPSEQPYSARVFNSDPGIIVVNPAYPFKGTSGMPHSIPESKQTNYTNINTYRPTAKVFYNSLPLQVGVLPDHSPEAVHWRVAVPLISNPSSQLYVTTDPKEVVSL